jgi:hypothetical protein
VVKALIGKGIDALKESPVLLTLVLLQLLTIGGILYSAMQRQEAVTKQIEQLTSIIQQCIGK